MRARANNIRIVLTRRPVFFFFATTAPPRTSVCWSCVEPENRCQHPRGRSRTNPLWRIAAVRVFYALARVRARVSDGGGGGARTTAARRNIARWWRISAQRRQWGGVLVRVCVSCSLSGLVVFNFFFFLSPHSSLLPAFPTVVSLFPFSHTTTVARPTAGTQ